MTVNLSATEYQADERVDFSIALLSQQIWCWGRDILRSEGNWLIEQGFQLIRPPVEDKKMKNIYLLELPDNRQIMLRGFGIIYIDQRFGSIFVPRYEFIPTFSAATELEILPWNVDHIPQFAPPVGVEKRYCAIMLKQLILWIAEYEARLIEDLGADYRLFTLDEWDNGKRRIIPPSDAPVEWEKLVDEVDKLLEVML